MRIRSDSFYSEYHGHSIDDLEVIHDRLRSYGKKVVWLVGDSSLDNKHWLFPDGGWSKTFPNNLCADACNGYERFLNPPKSIQDVCYHLNSLLPSNYAAINCAIEERAVSDGISAHDTFVRNHMQDGDVVIISLGGNDLVLKSSLLTKLWLGALLYVVPNWFGLGLGHIFKEGIEERLRYICGMRKPSLIIPCSIYYPCMIGKGWANHFLELTRPERVHALIDACHEQYTSKITLGDDSIPIRSVALAYVLDPHDSNDYCQQVEPSIQGGRKMAEAFMREIRYFIQNQLQKI